MEVEVSGCATHYLHKCHAVDASVGCSTSVTKSTRARMVVGDEVDDNGDGVGRALYAKA